MKKLLSLALSLALILSMGITASASAVSFTDNNTSPVTEKHRMAVDYLKELNIISGFNDGTLRPEANLTRAEYIKMLYVVHNSGADDNGNAYKNAIIPFKDVVSSSWYDGYVKWAYKNALVAGKTEDVFAADDSVTGYEALKMSLTAIGYSQSVESFTGSAWKEKVLACANDAGLLYNITAVDLNNPIIREISAQIVYNTLLAQQVSYNATGKPVKGDTLAYKYFKKTVFSGAKALENANFYSDFGLHRTGTETDIASTKWIARELESYGLKTELQEVKFNKFDLKECRVAIGGVEIKSFPFWFPLSTGSKAIEAPLVPFDKNNSSSMKDKIVYYDMPGLQSNGNIAPIALTAKEAGALALIATITHPNGFPSAQNAVGEYAETALSLPCVIVSHTQKDTIKNQIAKGASASVLIDGTTTPNSVAYNVIGKLDNNAKQSVVITTPLSGWFTCNAERGGGVGLFLEMARIANTLDKSVNYIFIGNTGHELNFLGAHNSEIHVPSPEKVKLWIHFGSGIAAKKAVIPNYKFLGFSSDLNKTASTIFKNTQGIVIQNDQEKLMQSELGSVISKGYSAVGLYGANKNFHTIADVSNGINGNELTELGENMIKFLNTILTAN